MENSRRKCETYIDAVLDPQILIGTIRQYEFLTRQFKTNSSLRILTFPILPKLTLRVILGRFYLVYIRVIFSRDINLSACLEQSYSIELYMILQPADKWNNKLNPDRCVFSLPQSSYIFTMHKTIRETFTLKIKCYTDVSACLFDLAAVRSLTNSGK